MKRPQYEIVNEIITEYVRDNGIAVATADRIRKTIRLEAKKKKYVLPDEFKPQLTDYCYNWFNMQLEESFGRDCIFEKLNKKEYRILGAGYPYTGKVYHSPKNGPANNVYGVWEKGKLHKMSDIAYTIEQEAEKQHLKGKEKRQFVKARVNQSVFRDNLLQKYSCCCLCGVENKDILLASHIKPWAISTPDEKLDYNNGLFLCPNHDKLFDKGYITFDDAGKIQISEDVSAHDRQLLNISSDMSITITATMKEYMIYHRENVFKK